MCGIIGIISKEKISTRDLWSISKDAERRGLDSSGILFNNGKKEGLWVWYWDNGNLMSKGEYKNNKKEGFHFKYDSDGFKDKMFMGTFKNDKKISD